MSDTPRTDDAILRYTCGEPVTFPVGINYLVDYQFAQKLERELNESKQAQAECLQSWADCRKEYDQLHECARELAIQMRKWNAFLSIEMSQAIARFDELEKGEGAK